MKGSKGFPLEPFREQKNINYKYQALRHSLQNPDIEVCGLFVYKLFQSDVKFIPLSNTSGDKAKSFSFDKTMFAKYCSQYDVASIFHSHPNSSEEISDLDTKVSEILSLPSYIFSLKTKKTSLYFPSSFNSKDLLGRPFLPEFQDCVSFFKDYYDLNMNIKLSNFHKNWSRQRSESNNFLLSEIEKTFYEIDKNLQTFKQGDVLVFKNNTEPLLHLGVVHNSKEYWHHPIYRFSRKELFNSELAKKVYKIYRYKGL
mgnify:FL=1